MSDKKTYELQVLFLGGHTANTYGIPEDKLLDLSELDFDGNLLFEKDNQGTIIVINLKNALTVQYRREEKG